MINLGAMQCKFTFSFTRAKRCLMFGRYCTKVNVMCRFLYLYFVNWGSQLVSKHWDSNAGLQYFILKCETRSEKRCLLCTPNACEAYSMTVQQKQFIWLFLVIFCSYNNWLIALMRCGTKVAYITKNRGPSVTIVHTVSVSRANLNITGLHAYIWLDGKRDN